MDHAMKISPSIVRQLRTDRGWSQEHLAIASGLSLRTVQRIEAEGLASMSSVVSLAATFEVQIIDLQERQPVVSPPRPNALFLGLAVITVAALGEAGRSPGLDHVQSMAFAAINLLGCIVGVVLAAPPLVRLFKQKHAIAASLALIGTPLVTLMTAGLLFAVLSGRVPTWQLVSIGAGGAALLTVAWRELGRAR